MPFGDPIGQSAIRKQESVDTLRRSRRIVKHTDPDSKTKAARTRLEKSLIKWVQHHGGEAFDRPFSRDHKKALAKIEKAINTGGLFAMAMPRGSGKSTILKWAMLYCMLTGRRRYVVVIAATAEMSQSMIDFARQQIQESETLHAHYPHVCEYARKTDGKAIKAKYQLRADGKTSGIHWSKTTLVLPEVVDGNGNPYPSNGAILEGHGLTGAIRGKWKDTKTGKVLRPDFVLLDDPQSRESAESESQCNMRERIITGDVLGLAGPRKRIAAVMPCTIVRKGDLAARFLDHRQHPEWQGETCALVDRWPDAQETLWAEYAEIFKGEGLAAATKFYKTRRAEMDAGADLAWPHRVRDGELSALQTAENLLIETGDQFWAEYQNDPRDVLMELSPYNLTPEIVQSRVDMQRGPMEIPDWASAVVASTDINPSYALSSVVVAFAEDQTAAVLWYGLHRVSIDRDMPEPAYIRAVFEQLAIHGRQIAQLQCRPDDWAIDGGGMNFGAVTRFAGESPRLCGLPANAYTGRSWKHYNDRASKKIVGRVCEGCHMRADVAAGRRIRWVNWNSDKWKEVAQRAWLAEVGAPGGISLPSGGSHREFAEQACNERLLGAGEIGGKMAYNYAKLPGKNDFLDALAQAYALAAFKGIGTGGRVRPQRSRRRASVQMVSV